MSISGIGIGAEATTGMAGLQLNTRASEAKIAAEGEAKDAYSLDITDEAKNQASASGIEGFASLAKDSFASMGSQMNGMI